MSSEATEEEKRVHLRALLLGIGRLAVSTAVQVARLGESAGLDVSQLVEDGRHVEKWIADIEAEVYRGMVRNRDAALPGRVMAPEEHKPPPPGHAFVQGETHTTCRACDKPRGSHPGEITRKPAIRAIGAADYEAQGPVPADWRNRKDD